MTPDAKNQNSQPVRQTNKSPVSAKTDDDSFFDLLSRFQSKRMDDQRCSLTVDNNKENKNFVNLPQNDGPDDLIDMIAGMQSKRMDEQRVELPHLPGIIFSIFLKSLFLKKNVLSQKNVKLGLFVLFL